MQTSLISFPTNTKMLTYGIIYSTGDDLTSIKTAYEKTSNTLVCFRLVLYWSWCVVNLKNYLSKYLYSDLSCLYL